MATVEDKEAILAKATQATTTHTFLMIGLCQPAPAILSVASMAAAGTGLSVVRPPRYESL